MLQTQIRAIPTSCSAPVRSGLLQRKCACGGTPGPSGECDACRKKRLQRKTRNSELGSRDESLAPPIVHEVLSSPGQLLDPTTRAFAEPRFGCDFSQVRVHTDARAAQSARAVGALAFTVGQHIVFGGGQYAPASLAGRHLLAHELAHVTQQQASAYSRTPDLTIGAPDGASELEAERAAARVGVGNHAPPIHAAPSLALQRQPDPSANEESEPNFDSPQQRGGRPRATSIDAGHRGEDQVRVAVTRYLCDCIGRNVSESRVSTQTQPGPGVTLEFCHGRATVRLHGEVVPSTLTTGRATVRGDVIVGRGGTGVRVGVEGEVRNTGSEPQVVGRVDVRGRPARGPEVGVGGEVSRGTQTGRIDTAISSGVDVDLPVIGRTRITGGVTNPQDSRLGWQVGIGGNLPGQTVDNKVCRECRCPVVYECLEDIPPRDYPETVIDDVEERHRLRYYFKLDTDQDTTDATLRRQSADMLEEVARRVSGGARVVTITGYASPEDNRERPVPNQQLSLSRAQRLRSLLASRLGANATLPGPSAGGELFGRVATIAPGSSLADAILESGFGDPEDVTAFLFGTDIPNPQLADQLLRLLERVTDPAARLRLFGVDSPALATPLLAAIEQYVRNRGRGRRPWENIFGFLRYATVELSNTRQVPRQEQRRTSGSLTPMGDSQCRPYALQAEREGRFGPAAPEPRNESECPRGEPHNRQPFVSKCHYD